MTPSLTEVKNLAELKQWAQADGASLESILDALQKFGRPRVCMVDANGWYCVVEMNTTAKGAEFNIKSDFGMASPLLAAQQCLERVESAMETGRAA